MIRDLILAGLLVGVITAMSLTSAAAVDDNEAASFKVMTFNIRFGTANDGEHAWQHRRDAAIGIIRRHDPDVLGVQEALSFQIDELSAALPGYAFHGVGRDDGGAAGEYCGIFVRSDRFVIENGGHFWLSDTPEVIASVGWDAVITRMASWVVLRDRKNGRPVVVGNTHFDHVGEVSRVESAKLIRQRIQEIASGIAVVVMGDFNAAEGSAPYQALVDDDAGPGDGLIDAYRSAKPISEGDEGTFSGFNAEAVRGRRIDWVLHNDALSTVACEIDQRLVDGVLASDHDPVIAVLRYKD